MSKLIGFVVTRQGAVQKTYSYPHLLALAWESALAHAKRLAAGKTHEEYQNEHSAPVVVKIETYHQDQAVHSAGQVVGKWEAGQVVQAPEFPLGMFRQDAQEPTPATAHGRG